MVNLDLNFKNEIIQALEENMNEFFSNVEIGKAFLTLAQNPEAIRKSNRLNRIQKNSSKTTKKHHKYGAKSNNKLKKIAI